MPPCSFYLSKNSELYHLLQQEENASATIRRALAAWYGEQENNGLEAIEERLERIERKLDAGVVVGNAGDGGGDEVDASAIDEAMSGW